ncbi:glycoside hydrolase family 32 protein [Enterococcus olivae]
MKYTVEKANQFIKEKKQEVNDQYRQKIHAQPPIGWMNDPNGFIGLEEELHLFYQFYPYESIWGPMHWGHMKSDNGVIWTDLPVALAPDQSFDKQGCFSGTAIFSEEQLVLMYTGCETVDDKTLQQQCIATSSDLIHFDKPAENPVISVKNCPPTISKKDFRDPKIIQKNGRYYALIATKSIDDFGQIVLFESEDCQKWTFKSVVLTGNETLGVMWECPDLIELDGRDLLILSPIEMPSQNQKFTNLSSAIYFVGKMDWEQGTYEYEFYDEIDAGLDFYAPQMAVFKQQPVLIAWMQMWDRNQPTHDLTHHWAGCMTSVRKISLQENRLIQRPIIEPFTKETKISVKGKKVFQLKKEPVYLSFDYLEEDDFCLQLQNDSEETVFFKKEQNQFMIARKKMQNEIIGKETEYQDYREYTCETSFRENKIEIILDASSIEVFIGDGQKTMSMRFFPQQPFDHARFTVKHAQEEYTLSVKELAK